MSLRTHLEQYYPGSTGAAPSVHSFAFVALSSVLIAMEQLGVPFEPMASPLLAAMIVLVLGVPHGAFDVAIARRRWNLESRRRLGIFLLKYIALAGLVLALWRAAPALTLPAFLTIAAFHFSGDWRASLDTLPRLIIGGAMISAPALLNREEVITIFSWLAPPETATGLAEIMAFVAVPLLQASLFIVMIMARQHWLAAVEISAVLGLAVLTSPLCFFLVYFCGLHSLRHVGETFKELRPVGFWAFMRQSLPYAPLAMCGTIAGAWLLSDLGVGPGAIAAVFMALAALTVPHMVLVDLAQGERR